MFGIIKWIEKELDAAGQRVAAKSELNDVLEGQPVKKKGRKIPWRNETPEQKAFGWGMIFGYIGCLLSFLMAEWTISWMAL